MGVGSGTGVAVGCGVGVGKGVDVEVGVGVGAGSAGEEQAASSIKDRIMAKAMMDIRMGISYNGGGSMSRARERYAIFGKQRLTFVQTQM